MYCENEIKGYRWKQFFFIILDQASIIEIGLKLPGSMGESTYLRGILVGKEESSVATKRNKQCVTEYLSLHNVEGNDY